METILEGSEHLERELTPEPIAAPAAGSLVLHAVLAGTLLIFSVDHGALPSQSLGQSGSGRGHAGEPGEHRASLACRAGEPECAGHRNAEPSPCCAKSQRTEEGGRDGDSDRGQERKAAEGDHTQDAKEPAPAAAKSWRSMASRRDRLCRARFLRR